MAKNYYTVCLRKKALSLPRFWLTNKNLIHLYYENMLSRFFTYRIMKQLFFHLSLLLAFLSLSDALKAQHCGYVSQKNQEIERYTEGYVRGFHTRTRPRTVVKIPVVVHIVWRTPEENAISDAQIRGQIDSLTKDFRKRNADAANIPSLAFKNLAADCEIEFCLAQRDTLGFTTSGIVRRQTTVVNIGDSFAAITKRKVYYSEFGGDNAWRPDRYLNIWVCAYSEGGFIGWATPIATAMEKPAEDGCVIHYKAFGVSAFNFPTRNRGRTLVHEVGHYFNLLHTWGANNTCSDDDEVEDTPRQAGPNSGCPSFPATQSCPSNGGDMYMNYMDYPYDDCVLMFTKGQKARMWATLDGFRRGLILTGTVCDPFVGTNNIVEPQWSISPNPVSSNLTIQLPDEWKNKIKTIQLRDITGRVLLQKQENTEGSLLSVQDVPNGLYFLKISMKNQMLTKKVIVLH